MTYLGNGPRATGAETGWRMRRDLYLRCVRCGYYLSADPKVDDECLCGALHKDSGAARVGSALGDDAIEVYRRATVRQSGAPAGGASRASGTRGSGRGGPGGVTAAEVDAYLTGLPPDRRGGLEEVRRTARAAAPQAEEVIAYNMPALRLNGRFLVSYDAYRRHVSLFPASGAVQAQLGAALEPYLAGKGTIRFPAGQPIPLELVERVVRIRVEEVRAEKEPKVR
jgi:uncharacterized protein YdhG (YjbR/CyaY superfamily)